MAITRGYRFATLLVLALSYFLNVAKGHRGLATPATIVEEVFDVTEFGAKGNGKAVYDVNGESINGIAMMKAWQKACHCSKGPSKVVIPGGIFAVAQVVFEGPCTNHVTVELQGKLIADPDVSQFPNKEFVVFQNVDGVTFTGQGTLDVSNQAQMKFSSSSNEDVDFSMLMPSIKCFKAKNIVVDGLISVNPAAYHVLIAESQSIAIRNVKFDTKVVASNTNSNGIYISASSQVSVSSSYIRTGDDCVTVAPGSTGVSLTGLTCEAGQGIRIGSQAYYSNALDVKGVTVKGCTFKGSAFGVRINPRLEMKASLISGIKVEDLIMVGVQNPIVIDQQLSIPVLSKLIQAKISGVSILNIKGTTTTKKPLSFSCCPLNPCDSIEVAGIDLSFVGKALGEVDVGGILGNALHGKVVGSLVSCLNAKVLFKGKHDGLSCGLLQ